MGIRPWVELLGGCWQLQRSQCAAVGLEILLPAKTASNSWSHAPSPPPTSADHGQRHGRWSWPRGMGAGNTRKPNSSNAFPHPPPLPGAEAEKLPLHQSQGLRRV